MRKWYERHMQRWETRKRAELGDEVFLRKYIRANRRLRWVYTWLFYPILLVALSADVSWRWVSYARTPDTLNLALGIAASIMWVLLFAATIFYYAVVSHILRRRIERWTAEQESMLDVHSDS